MNANEMRSRIISESIKLFLQKGYNGAAISDIAKTLNITKAAFYWYFESKTQLLETIIDEFDQQFVDKLIATVENSKNDFLSKFKLSHKMTTEFGYQRKDLVLVFITLAAELKGTEDPIDEKITNVHNKFVNFYIRLIKYGIKEGALDASVDSNLMANIIVANHHGVLLGWHLNANRKKFDSKKAAKMYLDVLLYGILKKQE